MHKELTKIYVDFCKKLDDKKYSETDLCKLYKLSQSIGKDDKIPDGMVYNIDVLKVKEITQ